MNIVTLGVVLCTLFVLVQISRSVRSLAEINALAQLSQKPIRELLPQGWGLVELGDVIEVTYAQLDCLLEVTAIHEDGRIALGAIDNPGLKPARTGTQRKRSAV